MFKDLSVEPIVRVIYCLWILMFGINKTFKKELEKNYTQQIDGANIQTTEFMKVPGMHVAFLGMKVEEKD